MKIYLVLSQTKSLLSQAIKVVTGAEFNHVSLALSSDLEPMWSFGRRHPYNPFWGGFVLESIHHGTFQRFPQTTCTVLSLDIPEEKYDKIRLLLEEMNRNKYRYGYNLIGLCFAAFGVCRPSNEKYYCSEFVKAIFLEFGINGAEVLPEVTHPCDFLSVPGVDVVYTGLLREYENPRAIF